ncbi:hypothetical protein G9A89_007178 [Geosiphon pyriformis]|nr:hypothetical protein G9A89_007178 [Geosiphon pyriformis]
MFSNPPSPSTTPRLQWEIDLDRNETDTRETYAELTNGLGVIRPFKTQMQENIARQIPISANSMVMTANQLQYSTASGFPSLQSSPNTTSSVSGAPENGTGLLETSSNIDGTTLFLQSPTIEPSVQEKSSVIDPRLENLLASPAVGPKLPAIQVQNYTWEQNSETKNFMANQSGIPIYQQWIPYQNYYGVNQPSMWKTMPSALSNSTAASKSPCVDPDCVQCHYGHMLANQASVNSQYYITMQSGQPYDSLSEGVSPTAVYAPRGFPPAQFPTSTPIKRELSDQEISDLIARAKAECDECTTNMKKRRSRRKLKATSETSPEIAENQIAAEGFRGRLNPASASSSSSSSSSYTTPAAVSMSEEGPRTKSGELLRCTNCGAHDTPAWRRDLEGVALLCNACGLYLKIKGRHRPTEVGPDGEIRLAKPDRPDYQNYRCENCGANESPCWRGPSGHKLCNRCGLYEKTHGRSRPLTPNLSRLPNNPCTSAIQNTLISSAIQGMPTASAIQNSPGQSGAGNTTPSSGIQNQISSTGREAQDLHSQPLIPNRPTPGAHDEKTEIETSVKNDVQNRNGIQETAAMLQNTSINSVTADTKPINGISNMRSLSQIQNILSSASESHQPVSPKEGHSYSSCSSSNSACRYRPY